MKVEITKNKLLSVSLIAVIGASFLASCNNKKSDSKDQNQQTSAPGGNGGAGTGAGAGSGSGSGSGAGTDGGAVDPSLVDDGIGADLANNDLNIDHLDEIEFNGLSGNIPQELADLVALKKITSIKLTHLCEDSKKDKKALGVYSNAKHNVPVQIKLYDDTNSEILLSEAEAKTIKDNLAIDDTSRPEGLVKLSPEEKTANNYTRCANGTVPKLKNNFNVIYIKPKTNDNKDINLYAALKIGENNTIFSVAKDGSQSPLLIPILVPKNEKNIFDKFNHVFKVVDTTNNYKYKYISANYVGKHKSKEEINLTVNDISITDSEKPKNIASFNAQDAKLDKVIPSLANLKIGGTKELEALEFYNMNKPTMELFTTFSTIFANQAQFEFKDGIKLDNLVFSLPKEKNVGFLLKIKNADSNKHSEVKVKLTGEDSFGNPFTAVISDSKW
nr:hypothetical protein GTC16762_22210 [Pigmentibacter ruber]